MKKIVFYLSAIIIAAVIVSVMINFTACKKECSKCVIPPPDVKEQVSFDLMNKSLKSECVFYKSTDNIYYREIVFLASSSEGEKFFQFLKTYCISKNITIDEQSMAFVLYYDLPVSQSFRVTDEHIMGVTVYTVEGRKIMHHLFVRDENSNFIEIENVKVAVPFVFTDHPHFYLENYVFSEPNNKSFIIIMGSFSEEVWKNRKKYRTPMKYEVTTTKAQGGGSGSCGAPCVPDRGGCVIVNGVPKGCTSEDPINCPVGQMYDVAINTAEAKFFNLELMYEFRDNFLSKHRMGQIYIDNYYYLGGEYEGNIGFILAVQTALFFKNFNSVMEAFLTPDRYLTEIMFTDELSDSLLALLDNYEGITNSAEGKEILNSIREDVGNFRNKQLQEILDMIE